MHYKQRKVILSKRYESFQKKVNRIILTLTVRKIIFNMSERRQFEIINEETTLLYGAVKLLAENNFKAVIDEIDTNCRELNKTNIESYQKLTETLSCLKEIDPEWEISAETRETFVPALLIECLREGIRFIDTSDLENLNFGLFNLVHQILGRIREFDPTWSINSSIQFEALK
jgi:hypothetical protein